jgi:hypothetical protein
MNKTVNKKVEIYKLILKLGMSKLSIIHIRIFDSSIRIYSNIRQKKIYFVKVQCPDKNVAVPVSTIHLNL